MSRLKQFALSAIAAAGAVLSLSYAYASGSEPASSAPSMRGDMSQDQESAHKRSPRQLAEAAYREGFSQVKKADRSGKDADEATDPDKKGRALEKSRGFYELALEKFKAAVELEPKMHEAWNYLGYCQRHLGRHAEALEAYAKALQLKPDYSEATEYRGEAYLGLNRLDDARAAYLDLFAHARPFADQLLAAMQAFVKARREAPKGLDAQSLDDFAKWVEERTAVANQTASLSPGSPAPTWH